MTGKRRAGRDPIRKPPTLIPPPAPSVVIAPSLSRRQARLERKKQQRKRIGFAGGAAIGAVVLVLLAAALFFGNKVVNNDNGPKRTQTTVLLQLQAPDHTAEASVLLAHDSATTKGNAEILIPSRVIADVCGYNSLNFGEVLGLPGGDVASRQALSSMLENATIDGSWVLQPAQLTKLVNLVGGITVDVDVDVVQRTGGGGGRVLVPAGVGRHLNGVQAVEYATYSTSTRADASEQLTRLQRVIDATATGLPSTPTAVSALLRQLGPGSGSTIGATRLGDFLTGFATSERGVGTLLPIDLPTSLIDAGGAPSYRVDTAGANKLAATNLAGSLPADAGKPRPTVELLNAVGTPGLVATACPLLAAHNLTYAGSGNAAFDNQLSTVVVSNNDIDLGYRVADALKLPRSDVRRTSVNQSVADVIVTLGRDYK